MVTPSPQVAALILRIGDLAGQAARPGVLEEELSRAAADVRRLFDAAACSVALVTDDGEQLRFVASDGAGARAIVGVTLPINRGIAGWAAMAGQAIAVNDVSSDSRFARDVAEATEYFPSVILAAPLVDPEGSALGVVEVLDPQPGALDTSTALNILGTVGNQLAAIVRLSAVYDHLGRALLEAAGRGEDPESFEIALQELSAQAVDDGGGGELVALAATLQQMTALGPDAAALARRVLTDVVGFARTQR